MRFDSDRSAFLAALPLVTCVALYPCPASAQPDTMDSTYGRIEGDVDMALGAGAVAAQSGWRGEGELRLRYLETAGLFAAYEDANVVGSNSQPERAVVIGAELRPLFFFRWLKGHEARTAWFDLALDSLGLELAPVFEQPRAASFASQRAMQVGIGVELPLGQQATGLWLGVRGAVRWSEMALSSGTAPNADDRQGLVAVTLAWHQLLKAHLVDAGDRRPP